MQAADVALSPDDLAYLTGNVAVQLRLEPIRTHAQFPKLNSTHSYV